MSPESHESADGPVAAEAVASEVDTDAGVVGSDAAEHDAAEHDAAEHDAAEHDAAGHDAAEHDAVEVSADDGPDDLASVTVQRDEYLDHLRRVQAEFENYRKRVSRQQADAADQASGRLVDALLPVLDACDAAIRHGAEEVDPVYAALLGTLEKEGLERIDPSGNAFDPTLHDAVMHEPADGDGEPVVSDVLRPGYSWKGRVLRPAMVKVKG